jgi:hypothetical protein
MKKEMNHAEYIKKTRTMSSIKLRFIIKDCQEAIQAMPNGINEGYYQDEIHYCVMELNRREKGLKTSIKH